MIPPRARTVGLVLPTCLLTAPAAHGQQAADARRGDEMIDKYLADRTKQVSTPFLDVAGIHHGTCREGRR